MLVFCNLMLAVAGILGSLLTLFFWVFVAAAILSWVNPDPNNVIVKILTDLTEPVLNRLRPHVPPLGGLDFSIIIVVFGISLVQQVVVVSLQDYGYACKRNSAPKVVSGDGGAATSPIIYDDKLAPL